MSLPSDQSKVALTPLHRADRLFRDVCTIVDNARGRVALSANAEIVLMYWNVGDRINRGVLGGKRAAYGDKRVERLAAGLCDRYATREFAVRNLRRMMQFAQLFGYSRILVGAWRGKGIEWARIRLMGGRVRGSLCGHGPQ